MVTGIVTTVVGALLLSAIFAAIKSRWLYVVAPKLYLNTPISDGQIISLNIYNAGLTSEEDVAVNFRQAYKFELIGTSKSTLLRYQKRHSPFPNFPGLSPSLLSC